MSALTDYIDAWRTNDVERILRTVTPDVVISESFGPVYRGRDRVRQWCEKWNAQGSRVVEWSVTNEVVVGDTLVAEWRFVYHQHGRDRSFLGATVATAREGRIAELREYAITEPLYTWEGEWAATSSSS